ncbi:MAG: response regulator [Rhodanobacteraceae bacterium]
MLLVDDHVAGAQAMGAWLEALGSPPASRTTVRRRSRPKASTAAIALLDIGLLGMEGYELARALRAVPEFGALPLVALTGYGQAEGRERTRAASVDAHVTKPVHPDDLVAFVVAG